MVSAGIFVRQNFLRLVALSFLVLVPCYWQPRIQSQDLASHIYDAWLVSLVRQGKAPGLWLVHPWNNISFDLILSFLLQRLGPGLAQRIAVSFAVMVFFWGAFAFVFSVSRRRPWYLCPILAMLAYGFIFAMGFFNFYISAGFSLFALALLWRARGVDWLVSAVLLIVAVTFHPFCPLWALAVLAYVTVARRTPARYRGYPAATALILIVALRAVAFLDLNGDWRTRQLRYAWGADQFDVFGRVYLLVCVAATLLWLAIFLKQAKRVGLQRTLLSPYWQLYGLCVLAGLLVPDAIQPLGYGAPFALIAPRLSLLAGVLACAACGIVRPERWFLSAAGSLAGIFFVLLYVDHRALNRTESQVEALVRQLPEGQRVIGSVNYEHARVLMSHDLDRACIGHCYSYGNYEPSTGQFRLRAAPNNRIVMTSSEDVVALQEGRYRPRPSELPMYEILRCSDKPEALCMRELTIDGPHFTAMAPAVY